ncbi:MAG: hypothetical protein K6B68_11530 [Eubacterium sp.]|nr:hypothetical protein [Eubacterium sp.]
MERILLINGISPYIYYAIIRVAQENEWAIPYNKCLTAFLIQLLITIIISVICRDKKRLAKITMINKLIQIPYYILFFVFSVAIVLLGIPLMGFGLILWPILVAVDVGVFLSTLIPEEICTIKLRMNGNISIGRFILYFICNAIYVLDIVFSVLIKREYDASEN